MSARPHAYLQDTHPERPRSASKIRTPFGPSNGSEIFFQYLIIMSGSLLKQRMMDAHVDERQSACNRLAGHQFSTSCNEMSGYVLFGQVLSAHLRVGSRRISIRGTSFTSRIGTGSSELLNHLTDMFIAEKKSWEATTRNNPKLSSKNDDRADFHRSEIVRRDASSGCSSGDVSSGISAPSGGLDDNDARRVTEV